MSAIPLRTQDIKASLERLEGVFNGNYEPIPLHEGSRKVGALRLENKTVYLTFRGSVNSWWEVFSCFDVRKFPSKNWGLRGKVHAGLHSAFCKVRSSIDSNLSIERLKDRHVIVEGYSRGSGLAMLAAAYLIDQFSVVNLTILTYSPMNIFDQTAADAYKSKVKNQWNFACNSDFFPQWIGPSCLGFCPSGDKIEFSAEESHSFLQRVRMRAYTHLANLYLKYLIPLRLWEAHMPETYGDGAIVVFNKLRGQAIT